LILYQTTRKKVSKREGGKGEDSRAITTNKLGHQKNNKKKKTKKLDVQKGSEILKANCMSSAASHDKAKSWSSFGSAENASAIFFLITHTTIFCLFDVGLHNPESQRSETRLPRGWEKGTNARTHTHTHTHAHKQTGDDRTNQARTKMESAHL
jgi:hypothetical protein